MSGLRLTSAGSGVARIERLSIPPRTSAFPNRADMSSVEGKIRIGVLLSMQTMVKLLPESFYEVCRHGCGPRSHNWMGRGVPLPIPALTSSTCHFGRLCLPR